MSVGSFFDKIIMLAIGIYFIYLSTAKKDKLGNKAKFMEIGGFIITGIALIQIIAAFLMKKE
jgi:hypothetical protein